MSDPSPSPAPAAPTLAELAAAVESKKTAHGAATMRASESAAQASESFQASTKAEEELRAAVDALMSAAQTFRP